jgi:hypothetical protein
LDIGKNRAIPFAAIRRASSRDSNFPLKLCNRPKQSQNNGRLCLDFHGVDVRHAASSAFKDITDIKVDITDIKVLKSGRFIICLGMFVLLFADQSFSRAAIELMCLF